MELDKLVESICQRDKSLNAKELKQALTEWKDKAVVAELQKIADTDWTEEDLETNLNNRLSELKAIMEIKE